MHVKAVVMMKKVIFFFEPFQEKGGILLYLKASLFGKQNLLWRLHLQVCYLDGVRPHILGSAHSRKRRMQPWMPLGRLGYKSVGCAFFLARVCLASAWEPPQRPLSSIHNLKTFFFCPRNLQHFQLCLYFSSGLGRRHSAQNFWHLVRLHVSKRQ